MKPAEVALTQAERSVELMRGIVGKGTFTEAEVREARRLLFDAIDALDQYLLVPPGRYRKVPPGFEVRRQR